MAMNGVLKLALIFVLIAVIHEGECRRKILKGRRAITRTYHKESAVPAWAVVTIVGFAEIAFGVLLFFLLKIFCLDRATAKSRYVQHLVSSPSESP